MLPITHESSLQNRQSVPLITIVDNPSVKRFEES